MANMPWKSERCQKLVRHYRARKPAALKGKVKVMTKPRFIAGMLLDAHGMAALGAFHAIQQRTEHAWPAEADALLRKALNEELREVHGILFCKFCGGDAGDDDDLTEWMTTARQAWWACPACTASEGLLAGAEAPAPEPEAG